MQYLYIDESGSLADKNPFLIITIVSQTNPRDSWGVMKKARQKLLSIKKPKVPREIKFNNSSEKLRSFILTQISLKPLKIYVHIIGKESRKIIDSLFNYGLILNYVLNNILPNLGAYKIYIDQKFTKKRHAEEFLGIFKFSSNCQIINSLNNENLQITDFVAGAFGAKYNYNNPKFSNLIEKLVIKERVVKWTDLKRKALEPTGVRRSD